MPEAWNDRQIARFQFRQGLFVRRGLTPDAAERLAERLVERDADRDDRRCCLECVHRQTDGGCFALKREAERLQAIEDRKERKAANAQSWARGVNFPDARFLSAGIPDLLQRCGAFSFVTP
jgi:hypothetical protein